MFAKDGSSVWGLRTSLCFLYIFYSIFSSYFFSFFAYWGGLGAINSLIGPHFSQTYDWLVLAKCILTSAEEASDPTPWTFSAKRLMTASSMVLIVQAEFHYSGWYCVIVRQILVLT